MLDHSTSNVSQTPCVSTEDYLHVIVWWFRRKYAHITIMTFWPIRCPLSKSVQALLALYWYKFTFIKRTSWTYNIPLSPGFIHRMERFSNCNVSWSMYTNVVIRIFDRFKAHVRTTFNYLKSRKATKFILLKCLIYRKWITCKFCPVESTY